MNEAKCYYLMMLVTLTLLITPLLCTSSLMKVLDSTLAMTGEMVVRGVGYPFTVHVNIADPPTAAVVFTGPGRSS